MQRYGGNTSWKCGELWTVEFSKDHASNEIFESWLWNSETHWIAQNLGNKLKAALRQASSETISVKSFTHAPQSEFCLASRPLLSLQAIKVILSTLLQIFYRQTFKTLISKPPGTEHYYFKKWVGREQCCNENRFTLEKNSQKRENDWHNAK